MTDQTPPPPSGDQDPISGGQPPPSDAPPPPPVNPYETPAAPPPPYGEPQAPQYGTPPPQYGTPPPQYGAPPPQYGGPGQPAMSAGYPAMPGGPVETEPSKAMAITALVASLICCTPVGFVLGLIVVRRSKDGRNHGRGLGIAAMVISVILTLGVGAAAYGLSQVDWDQFAPVENLKAGECFNATDLADDEAEFIEDITEVSCDRAHDAEVLVTRTLTQDDAEGYDPADSSLCADLITADPALTAKIADPAIGTFGLTQGSDPNAGDRLVCVAYRFDGSKLEGPL
jgi:hypothetical protein